MAEPASAALNRHNRHRRRSAWPIVLQPRTPSSMCRRRRARPPQRRAIANALAENASVVFSMAPPTPDDARAGGLTQDDDPTQDASLV